MAKLNGEVTLLAVELKTQTWHMAFQVIQVFIVNTFSSGAASVVTKIINEPGSETTLLAENLPHASNFYISYFILQGLGIASGDLLNIGTLAMFTVVGKFLNKSPRQTLHLTSRSRLGITVSQIWQFGNYWYFPLYFHSIFPPY